MKRAVFTAYWDSTFRPILVERGETATLDTGRVSMGGRNWHRSLATFSNDGDTVTMERLTEVFDRDGYLSSHGRWTCHISQLNAETRELDGVTVLIPAWNDADARVYKHVATA